MKTVKTVEKITVFIVSCKPMQKQKKVVIKRQVSFLLSR